MAEVKLNGQDLGILWKPPYRVDVTGAAKAGRQRAGGQGVNLWINRMIGDEQLPEDSDRNPDGTLKSMAAVARGRQAQPDGPLHLHLLAAVEEGLAAPALRPAGPGEGAGGGGQGPDGIGHLAVPGLCAAAREIVGWDKRACQRGPPIQGFGGPAIANPQAGAPDLVPPYGCPRLAPKTGRASYCPSRGAA